MLMAYLLVGAMFFTLGLVGFVTRRNLIIMFLCTELMFQGIVVNLVGFSRYPLTGEIAVEGQAFGLFLLSIAAAEAALALALVVLLYRYRGSLDSNTWTFLRDD
jgi:NADH-quinone oxidoreductase subunit K